MTVIRKQICPTSRLVLQTRDARRFQSVCVFFAVASSRCPFVLLKCRFACGETHWVASYPVMISLFLFSSLPLFLSFSLSFLLALTLSLSVLTFTFAHVLVASKCRWARLSTHRHWGPHLCGVLALIPHLAMLPPPVCHHQGTGLSPLARTCSWTWSSFHDSAHRFVFWSRPFTQGTSIQK